MRQRHNEQQLQPLCPVHSLGNSESLAGMNIHIPNIQQYYQRLLQDNKTLQFQVEQLKIMQYKNKQEIQGFTHGLVQSWGSCLRT